MNYDQQITIIQYYNIVENTFFTGLDTNVDNHLNIITEQYYDCTGDDWKRVKILF